MAKKNKDEVIPEAAPEKPAEDSQVKEQPQVQADVQKELEDKLAEKNDQLLRLAAEFDNFRKRTQREKEEIYSSSKTAVIKELLPVLDNFERAAKNTQCNAEDYKKGIEMTFVQFKEILDKCGVEAFGEAGEKFDPNMHSAVMHVEDDGVEENTIAEVFAKGYKIGDKVVRFAVVKVAN